MRLSDVAQGIGARVLTHASRLPSIQVERVSAADKLSDLMDQASDATVLVSHLSNPHLAHIADLLDVPCICLLDDAIPGEALVQAAQDTGKVLLVSPTDLQDTCRRLRGCGLQCIHGQREQTP